MVEDCTITNLQDDNLNEEGERSVKLTETQDGLKGPHHQNTRSPKSITKWTNL